MGQARIFKPSRDRASDARDPIQGNTMKPETMQTAAALLAAGIPDKAEQAELLAMLKTRATRKEKMLTTRAACALACVNPKTLFRWESKGYLHPRRITPSRVRWPQTELETFLCETAEA